VKLLVTGGAGYIGGVVVAQLVAAGHNVTVADDLSTGYADAIPAGATLVAVGIHDIATVLTPQVGYHGVLHFAAKIAAGESVQRPEWYWHTNVVGSLALLDAVRAADVPRLVFSSTAAVYGNPVAVPISEDAAVAPTNPYGWTKLAVDMAIAHQCTAHGLAAVSLRYFNVAGAANDPDGRLLGERHDPETHLIPIALEVAAGRRDKLQIFGEDYPTPDGTCVRDYIHVDDLAAAHLLALEASRTRPTQDLQPGQRQRLLEQAGRGCGPGSHRRADARGSRPPPPRRPGRTGRLVGPRPSRARLGADQARPARHRCGRMDVRPHPRHRDLTRGSVCSMRRTAGSTASPANGFWCPRTARPARGRGR